MPDDSQPFTLDFSEGDLPKSLDQLPKEFRDYVKQGLLLLSRVPEESYHDLAAWTAEHIGQSPPADSKTAGKFGVTDNAASARLFAAAALVTMILTASQATSVESLGAALLSAGLLTDKDPALTNYFAVVVQDRSALIQKIDRSRLGAALLPSLVSYDSVVDIRAKFKDDDQVLETTPVVIFHFKTDSNSHELFFQITRIRLESLVKSLEDTLKKLRAAEEWAQRQATHKRDLGQVKEQL